MNSITRELNIVANFDKIQRSKTRVSSIVKQVAKYTSKLYSKCGNDIMW